MSSTLAMRSCSLGAVLSKESGVSYAPKFQRGRSAAMRSKMYFSRSFRRPHSSNSDKESERPRFGVDSEPTCLSVCLLLMVADVAWSVDDVVVTDDGDAYAV